MRKNLLLNLVLLFAISIEGFSQMYTFDGLFLEDSKTYDMSFQKPFQSSKTRMHCLDSITHKKTNPDNNQEYIYKKEYYKYNKLGQTILEELVEYDTEGAISKYSKHTLQFDDEGRILKVKEYSENDADNYLLTEFNYDDDQKIEMVLHSKINEDNEAEKLWEEKYTYHSNNKLATVRFDDFKESPYSKGYYKEFNVAGVLISMSNDETTSTSEYQIDENNKRLRTLITRLDINTDQPSHKINYGYNEDGFISSINYYDYNFENQEFEHVQARIFDHDKKTYSFHGNNDDRSTTIEKHTFNFMGQPTAYYHFFDPEQHQFPAITTLASWKYNAEGQLTFYTKCQASEGTACDYLEHYCHIYSEDKKLIAIYDFLDTKMGKGKGIGSNNYSYSDNIATNNLILPFKTNYFNSEISHAILSYNLVEAKFEGDQDIEVAEDYTSEKTGFVEFFYSDIEISIDEVEQGQIALYPNPASQQITCEFEEQEADLRIYNLQGQLILQQTVVNKEQVNISMLEAGVYVCKINSGKKQLSKKLLVE